MAEMTEKTVHYLKCHQGFYIDILTGAKKFEIRRDDRSPKFSTGDLLVLSEIRGLITEGISEYTGNNVMVSIDYVLRNAEKYGLMEGFCCMAISIIPNVATTGFDNILVKVNDYWGVNFVNHPGVEIESQLTFDWTTPDWNDFMDGRPEVTKPEMKIDLIRTAGKWYIEENVSQRNYNIYEKCFEFEKWMGW